MLVIIIIIIIIIYMYPVSQIKDTLLLPVILPNIDHFRNSFTNRLVSDCVTN